MKTPALLLSALLALPATYHLAMAQSTDTGSGAKPARQAEIPVRSVVLYSSGVGYFEHAGRVEGTSSTELRFKTAQINDILKSLVLQDMDGGRVSTITYPSQDPVEKTLRSFQIDITGNPTLSALLQQLRGAAISLTLADRKVQGTILGVEMREVPVGEQGAKVARAVLNVLSGASIQAVELESVRELTLDDPQLQQELSRALAALAQARDQDKKPVLIDFQGEGNRRVRIGYVVEAPVWKTSYRLILSDQPSEASIQGWAIVENQTENDWNGVELSLVSGRPISFVQDLYQPLYIPRPVVQPELFAGLNPQVYGAGQAPGGARRDSARSRKQSSELSMEMAPSAAAPMKEGDWGMTDEFGRGALDATASVQSIAGAQQVGELFSYTVSDVSLPRQKSAMLPIITDKVEVEKLSIYNAQVLNRHPLNGVLLKNSTGKHLLQGPVTVLEAGAYAGDARIDNVPPGQQRLLSYGIDLQVVVDPSRATTDSSIQTARISKGVLYLARKNVFSQSYAAENKAEKARTVVIEHPIRAGWKLVDTPEPMESTPSHYRFRFQVEPGKSGEFTVKEEIIQDEGFSILGADLNQLVYYTRAGEIPQKVRDALSRAATLKRAVVDAERSIADLENQVRRITEEQSRIRENMRTVEKQSQYYNRLLAKLNEQESALEKLQEQLSGLREQRDTRQRELENYLAELEVG
jgi:hypothetical protein